MAKLASIPEVESRGKLNLPDFELSYQEIDGCVVLSNTAVLSESSLLLHDFVALWASSSPDRPFLIEGMANECRRVLTYASLREKVEYCGPRLLGAGCTPDRPLLIIAPNSIDHAVLALSAMSVGVPVAPVSMAYVAPGAGFDRLHRIVATVDPAVIFLGGQACRSAVAEGLEPFGAEIIGESFGSLSDLPAIARRAKINPDNVAKLLFTSGSTGEPKGVINTHRMMVSNQMALQMLWPFLESDPPVLVDWLPWNHTFGGNVCFNLVLCNGGTLHIDQGKPVPALAHLSAAALSAASPTVYFNVPSGFEAILPFLESDAELRQSFFARLKFAFAAGAALPTSTRERFAKVCAMHKVDVPILGGWGSTETGPFSTATNLQQVGDGNLGSPIPGTQIKLVQNDGKFEMRVKGPNVMPGYWRDDAATNAAFDSDGFYRIGDAGRFADPGCPDAGLIFDGRVSENFKLSTGTWVNVGTLRTQLVSALAPLVNDVVIAGHDGPFLGAYLFLNEEACWNVIGPAKAAEGELEKDRSLIATIRASLKSHNDLTNGSSTRVERFAITTAQPVPQKGEITDKGYVNQRAVLNLRRDAIEHMLTHGQLVDVESRF
jgi:feruloyl-CoA synthase